MGLRGLACWDCGFQFRRRHGCFSLVNALRCKDTGLCEGPIPRPEESYRVCTRHSVWSGSTVTLYTCEHTESGETNKDMYLMTPQTYLFNLLEDVYYFNFLPSIRGASHFSLLSTALQSYLIIHKRIKQFWKFIS
jgi:hypothetical protein